jgi:hypothetical protein
MMGWCTTQGTLHSLCGGVAPNQGMRNVLTQSST